MIDKFHENFEGFFFYKKVLLISGGNKYDDYYRYIFLILGLLMLIKPYETWKICESWKHNSITEPSDLYIAYIRFLGIIFILVGITSII